MEKSLYDDLYNNEFKELLDALYMSYETMNYLSDILKDHNIMFLEDVRSKNALEIVKKFIDKYNALKEITKLVIHEECGLPIELCICKNGSVKYDEETNRIINADISAQKNDREFLMNFFYEFEKRINKTIKLLSISQLENGNVKVKLNLKKEMNNE